MDVYGHEYQVKRAVSCSDGVSGWACGDRGGGAYVSGTNKRTAVEHCRNYAHKFQQLHCESAACPKLRSSCWVVPRSLSRLYTRQ
jgi:hypothetical protein